MNLSLKRFASAAIVLFYSTCYADCLVCPPGKKVIFVNNANPLPGDGSLNNPYNDLTVALSPTNSSNCDIIYVFPGNDTYNGYFVLQDNQRLLGTTAEAFQLCPEASLCNAPTLTNPSMTDPSVVRVVNNNEVSGFNIICNSKAGIAGGVFTTGDLEMANALISHNTFTISGDNAQGIQFMSNLQIGTVTISDCTMIATDSGSQTNGISFLLCGNGDIEVSNSSFIAANPSAGLQIGIFIIDPIGYTRYFIHHNIASSQTNTEEAIFFNTFGFTGSQSFVISDNTIDFSMNSSIVAGIRCVNYPAEGATCVSLQNNHVVMPTDIPGYLVWNGSTNGLFLNFDNSNDGTIQVNSPNAVPYYDPYPSMPVTLTTGCQ